MGALPITVKGTAGELIFTGDTLQIRRTGVLGTLRQLSGVGRGNKDIHLSAVTAIRVERGSLMSKPFIEIIHSGSLEQQGGAAELSENDNVLYFSKSELPAFEAFRDAVMAAKTSPSAVSATECADPLQQLQKLSELHKAGVLTDAEFAQKKQELLAKI